MATAVFQELPLNNKKRELDQTYENRYDKRQKIDETRIRAIT